MRHSTVSPGEERRAVFGAVSIPAALTGNALLDLALCLLSYLLATALRRVMPIGKFVGIEYEWYSARLYLAIGAAIVISYVGIGLARLANLASTRQGAVFLSLNSIFVAVLAITVVAPAQSGLQKVYFVVCAVGLRFALPFLGDLILRGKALRRG